MRILFLLITIACAISVSANDAIIGIWENTDGKSQVHIYKVNNKFYGKLVKIPNPYDENGLPKLDKHNPDKKLQSNPLVGVIVLKDLMYFQEEKIWKDGKVYNPHDGRSYSCKVTMKDHNTLSVRGYMGFSLFGKTCTFVRLK